MAQRNAAPLPPERDIQRAVISRLAIMGVRLWRRNVGAVTAEYQGRKRMVRFAAAGQADLWGIGPDGRHWEVEVKRPGNKPTPKQLEWLRNMTARGAVAYWTDCPATAGRVAAALLGGGRIVWLSDGNYDIDCGLE